MSRRLAVLVVLVAGTLTVVVSPPDADAAPVFRVNAGGPVVDDWSEDTSTSPSPYVNTGNAATSSQAVDMSDPSIPAGTPMALFQSERWDPPTAPEMLWSFPVTPGAYEVRMFFAEIYGPAQVVGGRVFDVEIEGGLVLDDYDVFARVGADAGVVESFIVSADSLLEIEFLHVVQNPTIKAIEISPTTLPGAWQGRAPSDFARQEVSYVHSNGFFYLAGGNSTRHERYNPRTDAWTGVASLPASLDHIQGVEFDGSIYYIGGLAGFPSPHVDTVDIYDPASDSFGTGTAMPRGRGAGGAAATGDTIYYAGGLHNGAAVPWFDAYDPVTDTWTQLPDMPRARDHFQAVVADGKLYAIGGRDTLVNATIAEVDVYDLAAGTWSTLPTVLPTPRGGAASVLLGQEIVIIGGEGGGQAWDTVEAYDITTGAWRTLTPMPTARHGIQAVECAGGVYVAAGGTAQGGGQPTAVHEVLFLGAAEMCEAPGDPVPLFRVNAGGPVVGDWSEDTSTSPSPYVNTGNAATSSAAIDMSDPSIPAGTPMVLFQSERWDPPTAPEMLWSFPVTPGAYEVRMFFAETYGPAQVVGGRVFDVEIEGGLVLDDYDVFGRVGADAGVVESFAVSADSSLEIEFLHVVQNPTIKAIEISPTTLAGALGAAPAAVDFGSVEVGATSSPIAVELRNLGGTGDPPITLSGTTITGPSAGDFTDDFNDATPVTLAPGESTLVNVTFHPSALGERSAILDVTHSGTNDPLTVPLAGNGTSSQPPSFGKSVLQGVALTNPTSLQFGPDGRLYVAQMNGQLRALTVTRNGPDNYTATAEETIPHIAGMANSDDDGSLNPSVLGRLVTGIAVTGTASNPVIYVASSDPRIGAGPSGTDLNLDTNSGVVSRLTWTGSTWEHLELVRGLPRSEENHHSNGLAIDVANNMLYLAQGGHTNKGAPSNNFALLPEYALSAAILSIDLTAIGDVTYDLPTLDDEDRPGANDAGDPFGGNDGKNQAMLVPGGPVQIHAPGFRNPYDLLLTADGRMYVTDNGGNAGWGDLPVNEGLSGVCTNDVNEPGLTTSPDSVHYIPGPGYYGGHPNPTRGNTANTFNATNPQSPVTAANPVECDFRDAIGLENGAIATFNHSTDGLAEYTASNFGATMSGDLLAAGWNSTNIYRLKLDPTGASVVLNEVLFSGAGTNPLDVTTQPDSGAFPGTIWVADWGTDDIFVYEPTDTACSGAYEPAIDEDADGYSNADEIDNGTNPCSAGDIPPDWDGDFLSNLNDPDDDNDGQLDTSDPFAIDPDNGSSTTIPVSYTWENDAPDPGAILNLGFTGLMTNGTSDYETLFDATNMTAGGAAGVMTIDAVPEGDALGASNTQEYGFQFGFDPTSSVGQFVAHTRIIGPFSGITPTDDQSMGMFVGTGDQDNYVKLVAAANGGAGGVQLVSEVDGVVTIGPTATETLPGSDYIDLYLEVDPATATVSPSYSLTTGGATGPLIPLGTAEPIPASWLLQPMAAGTIATSSGPGGEFPATWDFIEVVDGGSGVAVVSVVASDGSAAEAGLDPGEFMVSRDSADGELVVAYSVGGSAESGVDYVALSGSVSIAAGELTAVIPVSPLDDDLVEGSETVTVSLSDDPAYTIGSPASATVAIADDDVAAGQRFYAVAEVTNAGVVTAGGLGETQVSDDVYEVLGEETYANGKRTRLEHVWTFQGLPEAPKLFAVEAFHDSTEENFLFEYSADGGVTWSALVTVTKTVDDHVAQTVGLPLGTSGDLLVRVRDSDRSRNEPITDTLSVDHLYIEVVNTT